MLSLLLLSIAPPQGDAIPAQPATVEVRDGRARLLDEEGGTWLGATSPEAVAHGPAHLEVTAGSVVFVSWRGLATLRFEGPASFEWAAAEPGGVLAWRVVSVHALEAELRRGTARLDLPRGWVADFTCGAYHLRSLADGGTRVDHAAGDPVRVTWRGGDAGALPPLFLESGQSARLTRPPEIASPPDRSAAAPAWTSAAWPWGGEGVPNRPDLGHGPGWNAPTWPFAGSGSPEPWDEAAWPWSEPAREPAPHSGSPTTVRVPAERPEFRGWGHAPWPRASEGEAAEKAPSDPLDERPPAASRPSESGPVTHPDSQGPHAGRWRAPDPEPDSGAGPVPDARPPGPAQPLPGVPSAPEAVRPQRSGERLLEPTRDAAPQGAPDRPSSVGGPPLGDLESSTEPPRPAPDPRFAPSPAEPSGASGPAPPDADGIVRTGPLRYRAHPALLVERLPSGDWRARLPEGAAGGSAQVIGERIDLWIAPGGAITVDAEGGLLYHVGPVSVRAGTAGGR